MLAVPRKNGPKPPPAVDSKLEKIHKLQNDTGKREGVQRRKVCA